MYQQGRTGPQPRVRSCPNRWLRSLSPYFMVELMVSYGANRSRRCYSLQYRPRVLVFFLPPIIVLRCLARSNTPSFQVETPALFLIGIHRSNSIGLSSTKRFRVEDNGVASTAQARVSRAENWAGHRSKVTRTDWKNACNDHRPMGRFICSFIHSFMRNPTINTMGRDLNW